MLLLWLLAPAGTAQAAKTWGEPTPLPSETHAVNPPPQLLATAPGEVALVWDQFNGPGNTNPEVRALLKERGLPFSPVLHLGASDAGPAAATDGRGRLLIASARDSDHKTYFVEKQGAGAFTPPQELAEQAHEPLADMNALGQAVVGYTRPGDRAYVRVRDAPDLSFGPEEAVPLQSTGCCTQNLLALAMGDKGTIVAVTLEEGVEDGVRRSRVLVAVRPPAGRFGPAYPLDDVERPVAVAAVDAAGRSLVAWRDGPHSPPPGSTYGASFINAIGIPSPPVLLAKLADWHDLAVATSDSGQALLNYTGIDSQSFGFTALRRADLATGTLAPEYDRADYGGDAIAFSVPADGVGAVAFPDPSSRIPTVRRGPPALGFCPPERLSDGPGGVDRITVDSAGNAAVLWSVGTYDPPEWRLSEDEGDLDRTHCGTSAPTDSVPITGVPTGTGTPEASRHPRSRANAPRILSSRGRSPWVAVRRPGPFRIPGVLVACPSDAAAACRARTTLAGARSPRVKPSGVLGQFTAIIPTGNRRPLYAALSRRGYRTMSRRRRLPIVLTVSLGNESAHRRTSLRLTLARRR